MEQGNESVQRPAGFCRACGKRLSQEEVREYQGTIYCEEHSPQQASTGASSSGPAAPGPARDTANPYTAPPPQPSAAGASVSPGLAFILGFIPGVGAIYNGQYAKGFVHVLIAGLLFSLSGHESGVMEPLFKMFIPVWIFYMAFEAYHTAKKKSLGEPVDEFSSIFPNSGPATGFPVLPVLLIALGVLFLLNNLDIVSIRQMMPYAGPVLLIGLGVYLLYARLRANAEAAREVSHGRN
ncbi:MAG: DUF5668 domain-containing protein [Bryobacterales bacterium]|nr:DUF5668 domain-containing protein [Bryobacterales bacterium]